MYSNVFNIDFSRVVLLLTPIKLRKNLLLSIFTTLINPFIEILSTLNRKRADYAFQLSITGQVCKLEYLLNSLFDPNEKRIYLLDGYSLQLQPFFVYNRNQHHADKLVNYRLFGESVLLTLRYINAQTKVDFFVCIPRDIEIDEVKLKSIINTYKNIPATWQIKYI